MSRRPRNTQAQGDQFQYWGHGGGDAENGQALDAWLEAHPAEKPYRYNGDDLCVHTPEGKKWAKPGDWLQAAPDGVRVESRSQVMGGDAAANEADA